MSFLNERAFTLIELMIVLTMMGILTTLSWEGYKALLTRYQLQGVSRVLVSDLRAVQQQAVTTRQRCWIRFDPEQGGYSVWVAGSASGGDQQGRLLRQVRLASSVRFGSAPGVKGPPSDPVEITELDGVTFRDNRVVFMPSGGLGTGAGAIYFTDDPAGKGTSAITVTVSGHVRHYWWAGNAWQ